MIKRLLSVILVISLLAAMLASCGGNSEITETGDGTKDAFPSDRGTGNTADSPDGTDKHSPHGTETEPQITTASPPVTDEPSEDVMGTPEVTTLTYVALGDSICYGYGLASPETERYSAIIDGYIDLFKFYECNSRNYGVNGQTSSELLSALESDFAPELHGADIVSISIGANNVLGPAMSLFTNYTLNLLVDDAELRAANNAEIYRAFETEASAGIEQFSRDLPLIIAEIRGYAPDAQIIFQTIYNPYNNVSLSFDLNAVTLDLNETADSLVSRLNEIIKSNAHALEYDVADVYEAFESETGVVNAGSGTSASLLTGLDPHPTAKGHRIIADTVCAKIYID